MVKKRKMVIQEDVSTNILWLEHCFEQSWPKSLWFGGRPGLAALLGCCPEGVPRWVRAWLPQSSSDSGLPGWTPKMRGAGRTGSRAHSNPHRVFVFPDRGSQRRKRLGLEHLGSGKVSYLALRGRRIRTGPLHQTMGTSPSSDWIRNFKVCHECILLCVAIFCKPWKGCFKSGHMCGKCRNYSFPLLPPTLTLQG